MTSENAAVRMTMPGAEEKTKVFDPASIGLAGVILAVGLLTSFTHVRDVAHDHGWKGLMAWAPPVITELLAAASGVNIRWRLKNDIKNLAFPVAGLLLGLALSLSANEATATDGVGPSFARLPWGSILALLMPGSAFLVLMMIEPMFSRAHSGRAAEASHAQAVDILTVVQTEIGKITSEVHARITAFDDAARTRTEALDAQFRARTESLDAEFRARTEALDAQARARTEDLAEGARAQSEAFAEAVHARMAEVDEAVTDLVAAVLLVDATVDTHGQRAERFAKDLDGNLAQLTSTVRDAAENANQANRTGQALSDDMTYLRIGLDGTHSGLRDLATRADQFDARHQGVAVALTELSATVGGLGHRLSQAPAKGAQLTAARTVRAVTSGAQTEGRARTNEGSGVHADTTGVHSTEVHGDGSGAHGDSSMRISADEFRKWCALCMQADPEWTPDYPDLMQRTGYKKRWLQLRVSEAREMVGQTAKPEDENDHEDAEIVDAEFVDSAEEG